MGEIEFSREQMNKLKGAMVWEEEEAILVMSLKPPAAMQGGRRISDGIPAGRIWPEGRNSELQRTA